MLKGGGDEAIQTDDETLNGNGKAVNVNEKSLLCDGVAYSVKNG